MINQLLIAVIIEYFVQLTAFVEVFISQSGDVTIRRMTACYLPTTKKQA